MFQLDLLTAPSSCGIVWWCYRASAIVGSFWDTHCQHPLWICNSVFYVESKDLSFSIARIVFQLPRHPDEDWEVPTPAVEFQPSTTMRKVQTFRLRDDGVSSHQSWELAGEESLGRSSDQQSNFSSGLHPAKI